MKKIICGFLAIMLCLSLAACGSSSKEAGSYADEAPAADSGYVDSYEYAADDVAAEEPAAEEPAAEDGSGDSDSTDVSGDQKNNRLNAKKLIYKCDIELETLEFEKTISELEKLITKYDAFIEKETTFAGSTDSYGYRSMGEYTATIRVPSEKYKAFINETDGIGTLVNRNQNVTNVSQEYSDLTVELEVLEAQKNDYLEMLKEAKRLEDMKNIITISDKIATVSTKINKIKTRLNTIDNDVDYSYVNVTINEVREVVEYTDDSFGTRFSRDVKQSWYDFGYNLQSVIIWLVSHIWGILTFFGINFLILFIIFKSIRHGKKKREKKAALKNPENTTEK